MGCYEDLKGKRVLVTGASRGIGAGVARAFSEAGARVFLHYRSDRALAEKVASELPGEVHLFRADLGDAGELETLFQAVKDEFGGLDAAVNNAGVVLPPLKPEEITDADYHRLGASGHHRPRLDALCHEQGGHPRNDRSAGHSGG